MLKIASPDCRYHVFRVAYKSGFVDFTQLAFKSLLPRNIPSKPIISGFVKIATL